MNFRQYYLIVVALFSVLCHSGFCKSRQRRADSGNSDDVVKVTVVVAPPFVIATDKEGVFDGYCIDLLEEIAERADFEFEIPKVAQAMYGTQDESYKWTGALNQIFSGKADMAVAPLTITETRKTAIDFTEPWMLARLTALMSKNITDIKNVTDLANQDKVVFGTFDRGSTKMSFREANSEPYKSMWSQMASIDPSVFVANTEFGLNRVRKGNYALIGEQPMAEYEAGQEPCDLRTIEPFDVQDEPRSYAFGFTKGHDLVDDVNDAIRELKDDGKLDKLYKKWWKSEVCSGASGLQFSLAVTLVAAFLSKLV